VDFDGAALGRASLARPACTIRQRRRRARDRALPAAPRRPERRPLRS
jgi:hypothetical protein